MCGMKEFEILGHTSELKIRAFGKTKEELFLNMMKGMSAAMQPTTDSRHEAVVNRTIKITSQDIDTLLVDFLSEVLYLAQVNREVYGDAKFPKFSDIELDGEIIGKRADSFGEDIKAVTYHGAEIKKNKDGLYQVDIIYDI